MTTLLTIKITIMNNASRETSDAFMEVVVKKMEAQDKKISEMAGKTNNDPDYYQPIQELIASVKGLQTAFKASHFPTGKLQELSTHLSLAINLLHQPMKKEVLHHHHIPKLIWITAGLFIVFSLVCSGWYMTAEKLDGYTANDTKYRHLKLYTANKRLQQELNLADSIYHANPNMREIVLKTEEQNKRNLELLQKARRMESEATELKRKVYKR